MVPSSWNLSRVRTGCSKLRTEPSSSGIRTSMAVEVGDKGAEVEAQNLMTATVQGRTGRMNTVV